jgi:hypothetical protein
MSILGGHGINGTNADCFKFKQCKWVHSDVLKLPRRFARGIKFENDVYIIGGENGFSGTLDTVEKLGNRRWTAKLPMPVSRYCALQVNSKGIYIIGGHVAENPFSAQTSIFDPKLTLTSAIGNMIKGKEALLNLF